MPTDIAAIRQAHVDLLNRYAQAVHSRDWASLAGLFTTDAVFSARRTFGFGGGEADGFTIAGRSGIAEATGRLIGSLSATHVLISNHVVNVTADRGSAETFCYFRAYHAGKGERAHLFEESLGSFRLKTVWVRPGWLIERLDETVMIMLGTADAFGINP